MFKVGKIYKTSALYKRGNIPFLVLGIMETGLKNLDYVQPMICLKIMFLATCEVRETHFSVALCENKTLFRAIVEEVY